jgi:hypothetical protein
MPIERPDSFKQVGIDPALSAAKFHESVCDFGIVYGLGVQALGFGRIDSNLLPRTVAMSMVWANKTKYFVGAACIVLVVSALAFARAMIDRASYSSRSVVRDKIKGVLDAARSAEEALSAEQAKSKVAQAAISSELDLFKYRDIMPLVNQTILESLPNKKNNPEQAWLYEAFAAGDVGTVKSVERKQRKQLFVTGMSIYFTRDLNNATFASLGSERRRDNKGGVSGGEEGASAYSETMKRNIGGGGASSQNAPSAYGGGAAKKIGARTSDQGFVVTVTGYSPYGEIEELLDPTGAQDDANKWGLVTQLMHLDSMFDGNSPFELYKKMDKKCFEIQTGDVDTEAQMPAGIGVLKTVEVKDKSEQALIDPMTKEIISKQSRVDETGKKETDRKGNPLYQTNDRWFVLNMKLKWKDAPEEAIEAKEPAGGASESKPAAKPATSPKAPTAPKKKSGGGRIPDAEM